MRILTWPVQAWLEVRTALLARASMPAHERSASRHAYALRTRILAVAQRCARNEREFLDDALEMLLLLESHDTDEDYDEAIDTLWSVVEALRGVRYDGWRRQALQLLAAERVMATVHGAEMPTWHARYRALNNMGAPPYLVL